MNSSIFHIPGSRFSVSHLPLPFILHWAGFTWLSTTRAQLSPTISKLLSIDKLFAVWAYLRASRCKLCPAWKSSCPLSSWHIFLSSTYPTLEHLTWRHLHVSGVATALWNWQLNVSSVHIDGLIFNADLRPPIPDRLNQAPPAVLVREIIPQREADEEDALSTSLAITPIQTDTMSSSHDQAESDSASS